MWRFACVCFALLLFCTYTSVFIKGIEYCQLRNTCGRLFYNINYIVSAVAYMVVI